MILPTAVADAVRGVVVADIPAGGWGDVQVRDVALVLIGTGGATRGDKLTHDTAAFGQAVTAAPAAGTNNALIGLLLRTATANQLAPVDLAGPGVIIQG